MNSNSHGARPVHPSITMMKWIRTSMLSIKYSLSDLRASGERCTPTSSVGPPHTPAASFVHSVSHDNFQEPCVNFHTLFDNFHTLLDNFHTLFDIFHTLFENFRKLFERTRARWTEQLSRYEKRLRSACRLLNGGRPSEMFWRRSSSSTFLTSTS